MSRGGHNRVDLTSQCFGRLSVLRYAHSQRRKAHWLCACQCGARVVVAGYSLRAGLSTSCGCVRIERLVIRNTTHGLRRHRFYATWNDMIFRCYNQRCPNFSDYGGRGIAVCTEWRESPDNFLSWCDKQGPIPEGYSLDRYPDLNGPYAPNNCHFASPSEQNRNMRSNIWVEHAGERLVFKDFVAKFGVVSYDVAKKRVRLSGWNHKDAALLPAWSRREHQ